jgi:hypothetical protein
MKMLYHYAYTGSKNFEIREFIGFDCDTVSVERKRLRERKCLTILLT